MFKKLTGIFLTIAMALTSFMTPVLAGEPFETDSIGINPVIKDGQTYLINFGGGSITDGVYNDGTNNIFKFAGDPANVSITDGQLKIGNVTASTVGAFDYGFTDNPTRAFSNFEVSYDITVVNRRADQNLGFQFWKGNWSDGWTARAKVHTAFDAKMNLFEGSTSIENIAPASDRYRYIKDFGVPDLNRDTLPWETFRVNIKVDGRRVTAYLNNSATPIVEADSTLEQTSGIIGFFANAGATAKYDNLLINELKVENEREDWTAMGSENGITITLPTLSNVIEGYNIYYRNITTGGVEQVLKHRLPQTETVEVSGLIEGNDYQLRLQPVYKSTLTNQESEFTLYQTKVVKTGEVETEPVVVNPIIKDGQTYLVNFEGGSITDGVYNDGSNNIFKFDGDTANVSITDGQLKMGDVTASTVGAFDYGFADNPVRTFKNFEVSYDMTVVNRAADRNLGFQFWKNGWTDGWSSRTKIHVTYDAKMNLFEGSTSIANIAHALDKHRYIKDFGVPNLNRDILPWETFRVNIKVDGRRVTAYLNNSATPIVEADSTQDQVAGFLGLFATAGATAKYDNFLINELKAENEREDWTIKSDMNGAQVMLPSVANSQISGYNIYYKNITTNSAEQAYKHRTMGLNKVHISGLTNGNEYAFRLQPVYKSDLTNQESEFTFYKAQTIKIGNNYQLLEIVDNEFKITDEDDDIINDIIPANVSTVIGKARIKNNSGQAQEATFLIALYVDGALENVLSQTLLIQPDNSESFTLPMPLLDNQNAEVKIYAWDKIPNGMHPICEHISVATN